MNIPDIINGTFESCGGLFLLKNVVQLYKDKIVKGIHWLPVLYFASWGYWNMFYYPHLNQWFSFYGGCGIVFVNTIWFLQMLYYGRNNIHR